MARGRLIAVEGIDGAGKSTQTAWLAEALRSAGREVVVTREPTDGPFGREIRRLAAAGERLPAEAELELFLRDRDEHVRTVIGPALAAGRTVVTDRYFLSTAAYQGARTGDPEAVLRRCEARFPAPDLAVLLVVDPELGLARVGRRGESLQAFEDRESLEAVARAFAALDRPWIVRVDATGSPGEVHHRVLAAVAAALELSLEPVPSAGE